MIPQPHLSLRTGEFIVLGAGNIYSWQLPAETLLPAEGLLSWRTPPYWRSCTFPVVALSHDWSMHGCKDSATTLPQLLSTLQGHPDLSASMGWLKLLLWLHHSPTSPFVCSCFLHLLLVLIPRAPTNKCPTGILLSQTLFPRKHTSNKIILST